VVSVISVVFPATAQHSVDLVGIATPLDGKGGISLSPGLSDLIDVIFLCSNCRLECVFHVVKKLTSSFSGFVCDGIKFSLDLSNSWVFVSGDSVVLKEWSKSSKGLESSGTSSELFFGEVVCKILVGSSDFLGLSINVSEGLSVIVNDVSHGLSSAASELSELSLSPGDGDGFVVGGVKSFGCSVPV
jgi:hypothetical protein